KVLPTVSCWHSLGSIVTPSFPLSASAFRNVCYRFIALFPSLFFLARSFFAPRLELMAEILALRQQLAILIRTSNRPSPRFQDRLCCQSPSPTKIPLLRCGKVRLTESGSLEP